MERISDGSNNVHYVGAATAVESAVAGFLVGCLLFPDIEGYKVPIACRKGQQQKKHRQRSSRGHDHLTSVSVLTRPLASRFGEQPIHRDVLAQKRHGGDQLEPMGVLPVRGKVSDDSRGSSAQQERIDQLGPKPAFRHQGDEYPIEARKDDLSESDDFWRPRQPAGSYNNGRVNARQAVRHPQRCDGPLDRARFGYRYAVRIRNR